MRITSFVQLGVPVSYLKILCLVPSVNLERRMYKYNEKIEFSTLKEKFSKFLFVMVRYFAWLLQSVERRMYKYNEDQVSYT